MILCIPIEIGPIELDGSSLMNSKRELYHIKYFFSTNSQNVFCLRLSTILEKQDRDNVNMFKYIK